MVKPELLMPAGDMERLAFALEYGADAIYLGADKFGMRASPENFSVDEIAQAVKLAAEKGKKVYLTLNTIPTNEEVAEMPELITQVSKIGIDAFIVADIGVLAMVKKYAPDVEIHLSTQVGIMNYATANAAYEMGAKRVVLARELSIADIKNIRENTPPELELEAFVHGAMCVSVSGRCLLSQYLVGRDGNRGECAQPCRWEYSLIEKNRKGEVYDIGENEQGTFIMNADDMCTAEFLNEIINAGVTSLKVEGRAKSFYYVASLTAAYRRALDEAIKNPTDYTCPPETAAEIEKVSHRKYSKGFYYGKDGATQNTTSSSYVRNWDVIAVVDRCENNIAYCTQRGKFLVGDTLEALKPTGDTIEISVDEIINEAGSSVESAPHSMMKFTIKVPTNLPSLSILRKKADEEK